MNRQRHPIGTILCLALLVMMLPLCPLEASDGTKTRPQLTPEQWQRGQEKIALANRYCELKYQGRADEALAVLKTLFPQTKTTVEAIQIDPADLPGPQTQALEDGFSVTNSATAHALPPRFFVPPGFTRQDHTSTLEIKNVLGITIAKLTATGIFDTNGEVAIPVEASGDGSLKSVRNTANQLGPEGGTTWVQVTLSGSLPTNEIVFDFTCRINCDAEGNFVAVWSIPDR